MIRHETHNASAYQISAQSCTARLIDRFCSVHFRRLDLKVAWLSCSKFGKNIGQTEMCFIFQIRYKLGRFKGERSHKWRPNFALVFTRCKINGKMDKMSLSVFRPWSRIQSLIFFWQRPLCGLKNYRSGRKKDG